MKIMNNHHISTCRTFAVSAFLSASLALAAQLPADTVQLPADTVQSSADAGYIAIDSTMNALDYVLQRPAPRHLFPEKKPFDHLNIGIEAGADWMRTTDGIIGADGGNKIGFRIAVTAGDWFTPVHGWRLSLGAGRHYGLNRFQPTFFSLAADYMMNMSALLRGDNPYRRFEILGTAGIELELLHRHNYKVWGAAGIRLGLQPRFYITQSTYMYVEPRIGIFTDKMDRGTTWHRYDWNAQLVLGLGYRIGTPRIPRFIDNSLWIDHSFRDNMFVGLTAGPNYLGNRLVDFKDHIGSNAGVFIGKWFTPSSAARLSITAAEMFEPGYGYRGAGMADIDYMWNINSSMNGYDPDRKGDVNLILGLSGAYITDSGTRIYPGFHFGIQGVWNVSHTVGLFVEPSLRIFGRKFSYSYPSAASFLTSINVGLVYRFPGSEAYRRWKQSFDYSDFLDCKRYFFDLTGGVFMRFKDWAPNFKANLAFGKWFTPQSAWRIRGEYAQISHGKMCRTASIGADYMLGLTTLAFGYDDYRPFELNVFAGLRGGIAHYNYGKNKFIYGAEFGVQGRIRMSDNFDFLIEPTFGVIRIPEYTPRKFVREGTLKVGVGYRIGRTKSGEGESVCDDTDNFVNLSVGPGIYAETERALNHKLPRGLCWSGAASAGHWFNEVSGLQAGLGYEFITREVESTISLGHFNVDYMLNLTGLFTGNRNGRFSFSVFGGPGICWRNDNDRLAAVVRAGIETRFRLNSRLDFTLRPTFNLWTSQIGGSYYFGGAGLMPIGISYRF